MPHLTHIADIEIGLEIISTAIPALLLIHVGQLLSTSGWLGWAMVLGSFQCRGVLLLWHMVGQGPAVLAAGAGWVGYVLFFLNLVYPIFLF